ncbi:MAG: hypothetical protein P8M34_04480, partial [Saprospiraceae bacterium]|nr:hypothetical protein [Saprospiraceae bacterium]
VLTPRRTGQLGYHLIKSTFLKKRSFKSDANILFFLNNWQKKFIFVPANRKKRKSQNFYLNAEQFLDLFGDDYHGATDWYRGCYVPE